MKNVYLLLHCYEYELTESISKENIKNIGIYSSRKKAKKAIKKYRRKKGFDRFSVDCFHIFKYKLNKNYWKDGFIPYDGNVSK